MLRWIKKNLPDHETIKNHDSLKSIQPLLKYKYLWHLDVNTVSRAFAIGLFIGFLPIPLQMLWVSLLAVLVRANLPISVVLTWFNNPFTFIPINIFMYKVGSWVIGEKTPSLNLPTFQWKTKKIMMILHDFFIVWIPSLGKAFFIGVAVVSIGAAILGYFGVKIAYHLFEVYKKISKKNHT